MSGKRPLPVVGQGPMRRLKGGAAPSLTDHFRHAQAEGKDAAALLRDAAAATPHKLGLPTTWGDRNAPVQLRGNDAVVLADGKEVMAYGFGGVSVCGQCKYFDLENGRKMIVQQKFADRLVQEQEWQLKHLGVPPDALAVCAAGDGSLAVTVVSKSCDQFRPKSSKGRR